MEGNQFSVSDLDRYVEIAGEGFILSIEGLAHFKEVIDSIDGSAWVALGAAEIRVTPASSIVVRPYIEGEGAASTPDLRGHESSIVKL